MTTSSRTVGDLFDTFQREAFRLETLDDYSKSGNVDAYHAFLAGEPQPDDYNADWVEKLRSHTGRGKRVYRVHVLCRPLTHYLRFELGWGYLKNMSGVKSSSFLTSPEGRTLWKACLTSGSSTPSP